jgi:signal transduction histidine kinase
MANNGKLPSNNIFRSVYNMNNSQASILVVDDTRANLRLLTDILRQENYLVRPVPDARLALASAVAAPPDLILLDIMMPHLDGYQVCEQIKAHQQTREIPIIFLSALSEVLDKVKAFSVGGVDYITKPFQMEEVLARVETHLALHKLQKSLQQKNDALAEALTELRETQQELIEAEKMSALGKLVASIAHEINTPLGAIQASIGNIENALDASVAQLPVLFQQLTPERQADFLALSQSALPHKALSWREARKIRRRVRKNLAAQGIVSAHLIADLLVNMGLDENIEPFMPLLREKNNTFILQAAYNLVVQKNNSQNIITAVERASKIVFALKSYAHYDNSGQKSKADIRAGIELALTLYQNQMKHAIKVIREYGEIPEIFCYPDELTQVWNNLIYNAIQAMDHQGQLEITVRREDARDDKPSSIVVDITDSGKGIPPEIKERIFQAFFTTKPAGEGSGLGLDIVQKIINKHQGKIEVQSRPGKTTFSVYLPARTYP